MTWRGDEPGPSEVNPSDDEAVNQELLRHWIEQIRGGDDRYTITEDTIAENIRASLGDLADDQSVAEQIKAVAKDAINGTDLQDALTHAKEFAITWLTSSGLDHLVAEVQDVRLQLTRADQPTAQMTYLTSSGAVVFDIGFHGAISRSSKYLSVLWDSPPLPTTLPLDLNPGDRRPLDDVQLHALTRLDATYWRVLRWHGLFAVHFQFTNVREPSSQFARTADWLALRFAFLHEIAHLVSRRDGYNADSVSDELEADVIATHMLRYSVGPAFAALGASLYVYAIRRMTEAQYLVPETTHPHWLYRQSEIEVALGWSLHEDVRRAIEPVLSLHGLAEIRLGGAFDPRPPLAECFRIWSAAISAPTPEQLRAITRLEDLDTAFHSSPLLAYAIAGHHHLASKGHLPPITGIGPDEINDLAKSGRGALRHWLRDHPTLLSPRPAITYRSLACEQEDMSDPLRGVRARYAADHLGIAPLATDW